MSLQINLKKTFILLNFLFIFCSCNKNKVKTVHYELTGSYTGKLTVHYSGENGIIQTISNVSLPWLIDVKPSENVSSLRFYIQNTPALTGQQFEIVSVKIEAKNNNGKFIIHHSENNFYANQSGEISSDTITIDL